MRLQRLLAAAVVVAATVTAAPTAGAVDESRGTPGFCPDDNGVTVVVDFADLGGEVLVRCAPGNTERDGIEALRAAGFDVEGVQRYGEGLACRIEGRPAPDESLAVDGRSGYREACIDTPPASAHWSYWSADNGDDWTYNQWGVQNRQAINGGFEGWSFSLNATSANPTAPRIEPNRPESSDDAESQRNSDDSDSDDGRSDDAAPRDAAPDGEGRGDADESGRADSGQRSGGDETTRDSDALPMPKQREASPPPKSGTQDGVRWSGGTEDDERQAKPAADDTAGRPVAPFVAAGVLAVLAALIVVTAMRRRRARLGR